jgi:hypothetical protein
MLGSVQTLELLAPDAIPSDIVAKEGRCVSHPAS